jgi:AcrR family transcriptional regulator
MLGKPALAASLGVSKGGFYWHFKDRAALLAEMLDSWEQSVVGDVIRLVRRRAGPAGLVVPRPCVAERLLKSSV